ncbi:MAG: GLUG motif-containing protein [Planctomycetota bacterium]
MKKSLFIVFCIFLLTSTSYAKYSGGDGSEETPFQIATPNDLNEIGANPTDWDANFVMVNDINVTDYTYTQFNIIGPDLITPFTGIFDGNGHTISNFTFILLDPPPGQVGGLFGIISNGEVKNLNFVDPNVTGHSATGTLAGAIENGTVTNCHVKGGSIAGYAYTGGMVGWNIEGTLSKCSVRTSVTVLCLPYISCGTGIGGLVGINLGTIRNCYAAGSIRGDERVGGLVGTSDLGDGPPPHPFSSISNCYFTGVVDGNDFTGALVGYASDNTSHTSCFWDADLNPDVNGVGNASDPNVVGLPTAEMMKEGTFTDAGWDFVEVWGIGEGQTFPYLREYAGYDLDGNKRTDAEDLAIMVGNWLKEK